MKTIEKNTRPIFRSVASVLIQRVAQLAGVVLVVALLLEAFLLQRHINEQFSKLIEDVVESNVPIMALALWDIEPAVLQTQVGNLIKKPEIGYVRLQAATGQVFEAGNMELVAADKERHFKISHPTNGLHVGDITFFQNKNYFLQRFSSLALEIFIGYTLFAFVICIVIFYVLKLKLEQPLRNILILATSFNPQNLTKPVDVNRLRNLADDEIKQLEVEFLNMQCTLFDHIALLNNMIAEKEINQSKLEDANRLSQKAMLAHSQFLATMSHELRTPLNGILGMAQLLARPIVNDKNRIEFARTIVNSGNSLSTLLADLLDVSQMDANKLQLRTEACDIGELVHDVATLFTQTGVNKGVVLEFKVHMTQGEIYRVDAVRLRQMLSNLISNAIKFTFEGSIQIEAREIERIDNEAILEFAVKDSGVGIPLEKQNLLFKRFSQIENDAVHFSKGAGLGLSIVHGLAKRMGGDAGLTSEEGKGSRFWFRIQVISLHGAVTKRSIEQRVGYQLGVNAVTQPPHEAPPAVMQVDYSKHVGAALVVEDNLINQNVMTRFFSDIDTPVLCVCNGAEAVQAIQHGLKPRFILMDVQMPVMGGLEATRKIREWEIANGMPRSVIIGLTAGAADGDKTKCIDSGMDDVLFKPVDLDELEAKIESFTT
jgi:signal transduction histidine kinase/CheY-like chemotaxis protein